VRDAGLDLEPEATQVLCDFLRGAELAVAEFRVLVQVATPRHHRRLQRRRLGIERGEQPVVGERRHGAGAQQGDHGKAHGGTPAVGVAQDAPCRGRPQSAALVPGARAGLGSRVGRGGTWLTRHAGPRPRRRKQDWCARWASAASPHR